MPVNDTNPTPSPTEPNPFSLKTESTSSKKTPTTTKAPKSSSNPFSTNYSKVKDVGPQKITGPLPEPIPFTPSKVTTPWKVMSWGEGLLNTLDVPRAFLAAGALRGEQAKQRREKLYDKYVTEAKGKGLTGNKAAEYIRKKTYSNEYINVEKDLGDFSTDWESAHAWVHGGKTVSGSDISKVVNDGKEGSFVQNLFYDIALDPLTYIPIGDISVPIKAALKGSTYAIKGAKEAAVGGKVSTQFLANSTGDLAKATKGAVPFRPYSSVINQYGKKPAIPESLYRPTGPMADILKKLDTKIGDKYYYSMTPAQTTMRGVIASGLEAGQKAAAATFLSSIAKNKLSKIARAEAKIATQAAAVAAYQAPRMIDNAGLEQAIQPFVPHVTPDAAYVFDGKSLHKFGNEKEAKAWVKDSKKTDTKAQTEVPVTRGETPIVDTAPLSTVQAVVKAIPAGTKVAKDAKATLTQINKLVASVKGTSTAGDVAKRVDAIINRVDTGTLPAQISNAIREVLTKKTDAFELLRIMASSGASKQERDVVRAIISRTVVGKSGNETTIQNLVRGANWATLSQDVKKQILAHFESFLAGSAGTQAAKLNELVAIVGEEVAAKIAKTGVLDPAKKASPAALQAILKGIPSLTEKSYASMTELAAGLKSGDIIDLKILEKLVKAVDPENAVINSVNKAAAQADEYKRLSNILITKGPQTIADTERRLALTDAAVLMNAQGLSLGDIVGAYTEQRLAGKIDPLAEVLDSTRIVASENLAAWASNPRTAAKLNRTYESINQGLSGQFEYIREIEQSKNLFVGITTLGDLAIRSTDKAFQTETKAALLRQLTANTEAKILGNLTGLIRSDLTAKLKKSLNRGPTQDEMLDEFLIRGKMVDDALLSVLGSRFTYKKTAALAKGEKHYVYSSISEVADIFDSTEGRDIIKAALFPNLRRPGFTKYDALSFVGISKAVQRVLESIERGIPIDKQALLKDLKSRGETQQPWSAAFKKEVDKVVNSFADHLTKPDVVKRLQDVHKSRAIATVEDSIQNANIMSQDMWDTLMNGWKANIDKGLDSTAARAQLVRDWFYKFTYASGIFKQQSSEVAQAVFEAAAMMFVRNGKLEKIAGETTDAPSLIGRLGSRDPIEQQLRQDVIREINSMFKKKNADLTPNIDANKVPFPSQASVTKATAKLTESKLAYEAHIAKRSTLKTKAEATAWKKKFDSLQARLDAARLEAHKLGIPTHHWQNGEWVPSQFYNYELAKAAAKEQVDANLILDDAVAKAEVVDTKINFPSHQKLSPAATKKLMEQWTKENAVRSVDRMHGAQEEAAQSVLDDLPQIEALGLGEAETAALIFKETIARPYYDGEITTLIGRSEYRRRGTKGVSLEGEIGATTGRQNFAERFNASSGRTDLMAVQQRAEAQLMNQISNFAKSAALISRKWYGTIAPEDFRKAFSIALSRTEVPKASSAMLKEAVNDLRRLMDPIFGNPEATEVVASGIMPELMQNALRKYGLTEELGFIPPTLQPPKSLSEYALWLPFVEMPDAIKSGTKQAKTDFANRAKAFAESGVDPMVMVTRLAEAISFAKMEHHIITDFATRFNWKTLGYNSVEDAAKAGLVRLEGISGGSGTNFAQFLPDPNDGGLFPADIANQFMSINREINKIYNSGKMPNFIRAAMSIIGAMKATQTIMRLGHHVTNIVSDMQTAMILGARHPMDLKYALQLSKRYASTDVKTLIGKNKLDEQLLRGATYWDEKPIKGFELTTKNGETIPTVAIYKNGRLTREPLPLDQLGLDFENQGIMSGSHYQDDIQGLYEATMSEGTLTGARETIRQRVTDGLGKGLRAVEQPLGSATSYYSNIARTMLAMSVLRSRSFKSIDEAIRVASVEVHRAFPTIHSLAASERKGPRVAIMYYTWIRVAHNAFIEMFMNHTGAMLIPARIQFNEAEQNGMDPYSLGNIWGSKEDAPSYKTYSVYGPTSYGSQGRVMHKTSSLPMDVIDQWNLTYDPMKSVEANFFSNGWTVLGTIGSSTNPIVQRIGEAFGRSDWQTKKPTQINDFATLTDSIVGDLGFSNLLKGLGTYTPVNKGPDSRNPLTDEDRSRILNNWLFGQKVENIDTPANIKNTKTEQNDRIKSLIEMMQGK